MSNFQPLAKADRFVIADSTRCGKNRKLGVMQSLRNTTPSLGSGERLRTGCSNYTTVTAPTGKEILKVVGIQNPSQEDVHIWFANNYIYMNPYWTGSGKVSSNIQVNQTKTITGGTGSAVGHILSFTNADALGLSTTDDYYNGWLISNTTQTEYALITDYDYTAGGGGTAAFTIYELIATPISNYGFESVTGTADDGVTDTFANWTSSGTTDSTATARTGSKALRFVGSILSSVTQTVSIKQDFTITFYTYTASSGTDVVRLEITNPSNGYYYNFSTDTWQAGATYYSVNPTSGYSWLTWSQAVTIATGQTQVAIKFISPALSAVCYIDDVTITGLEWVVGDNYTLYRNFHANTSFTPAYNTTLANAPSVNVDNSIIRLSGGQSSTAGNSGIHISPQISRTYFPNVATPYSPSYSYIDKRQLPSLDIKSGTISYGVGVSSALETGKTYWFGIAPIYDGYQIGEIEKYESTSDYSGFTSGGYISSGNSGASITCQVGIATLNKRITGFALYIAVDAGNTTVTGRATPYRFLEQWSLTDSDETRWTYVGGSTQKFQIQRDISADDIAKLTNSYESDSGLTTNISDTMYSCSGEIVVSGLRMMHNVYVSSESKVERNYIFINPQGGNDTIGNSGVPAIDVFPNIEGIYKLSCMPTLGTKIQAIVPQGSDGLVVFKDKGIVFGRIVYTGNKPNIAWEVIDSTVGMTTLNAFSQDENGWIYFPSYDSIYRYRMGELQDILTDKDGFDWLHTYKNSITATEKENAVVWYLPKLKCVNFQFGLNRDSAADGFNGLQWAYYIGYGWRENRYAEGSDITGTSGMGIRWITQLQDGTVLALPSLTTAVPIKFDDNAFIDLSLPIRPYFHTGNIVDADSNDIILEKFVVNKTMAASNQMSGTLDTKLYLDGSLLRTDTGVDKTKSRLAVYSKAGEQKLGQSVALEYNTNSSSEYITTPSTNKIWQIDSIELWGDSVPRGKRVTD